MGTPPLHCAEIDAIVQKIHEKNNAFLQQKTRSLQVFFGWLISR